MWKIPATNTIHLVYGITPGLVTEICNFSPKNNILLDILDLWWSISNRECNADVLGNIYTISNLLTEPYNPSYMATKFTESISVKSTLEYNVKNHESDLYVNYPEYYGLFYKLIDVIPSNPLKSSVATVWSAYDRVLVPNHVIFFSLELLNNVIYFPYKFENLVNCARGVEYLIKRELYHHDMDLSSILFIGAYKYGMYKCLDWLLPNYDGTKLHELCVPLGNCAPLREYRNFETILRELYDKLPIETKFVQLFTDEIIKMYDYLPNNLQDMITKYFQPL
jgi:hypothetical protein